MPIYRVGPQSGGPWLINWEGPQAREPCKCLNGWSYEERLAKEVFWSPATRGLKKDSDWTITPAAEPVRVPARLAPPGSPQAKQLHHLPAQPSQGQSCHRQKKFFKNLTSMGAESLQALSDSLQPRSLWPARFLCPRGGSPGKNTGRIGQYWLPYLLEHCISCSPSCQPPWVPGAARAPATQAAAPPWHLALTGAHPVLQGRLRSKPQWTTHVQRWKQNHHWNPGAVWLRKKTQNLPTSGASCRLNPHDQLSRLCVYGI